MSRYGMEMLDLEKKTNILVFFSFFFWQKNIYCTGTTISAASIKRCFYMSLVHISVNTDGRVSVFWEEME